VDPDVQSAVSLSHLRDLPADVLDDLLTGAVRVRIPAASVFTGRAKVRHTWSLSSLVSYAPM
jgi:hypothetical protein